MERAPASRSGISTCTSSRGAPRTCCCSTGIRSPVTTLASAKWPSASAVFSKLSALRLLVYRGGVLDHQLDRVGAAVVVAPEMAGEVDRAAAGGGKELPQRALGDAKGDRLQPRRPERIGQAAAQVSVAYRLDVLHLHSSESEARLGVGGAERRQRLDMGH